MMRAYGVALVASLALVHAGVARAQYQDWEQAEDTSQPDPPPAERPEDARPPEDVEPSEPQEPEEPDVEIEPPARAGTFEVRGEVATYLGSFTVALPLATAQLDGFVISPLVGASFWVTDEIRLSAEVGTALFGYGEYQIAGDPAASEGGAAFVFGDPFIGAELVETGATFDHAIGLGVTLPAAPSSGLPNVAALMLASAMRGAWDIWLWAPQRLAIVAGGRIEVPLSEPEGEVGARPAMGVVASAEVDAAVLFYAGDSSGETLLAAQAAGNIEYRTPSVAIGGRIQGAYAPDLLPDRKTVQLAVMPYARLPLGETAYLDAAFVLNLLPPYGFSFAEGKVWSIRIGAGATF